MADNIRPEYGCQAFAAKCEGNWRNATLGLARPGLWHRGPDQQRRGKTDDGKGREGDWVAEAIRHPACKRSSEHAADANGEAYEA